MFGPNKPYTVKIVRALFISLLMMGLLSACSSNSRYQQAVDSTPIYSELIHRLPDVQPKSEPISKRGNRNTYEVWGKTYQVHKGLKEYSAEGTASWYGQKFHGHETSNGERFDVYGFTAAHKSLPLPSYVRVTNQANGKSLVVRVNDRGPFHEDRLIDLSYAAAVKLDFADKGTAKVKVEMVAAPLTEDDYSYVQVAAFHSKDKAANIKQSLKTLLAEPVYISKEIRQGKILHKVRIGPIAPQRLAGVQSTLSAQFSSPGLLLP